MRGPDWDEPMDEDRVDRYCAVAALVLLCGLGAVCVVAIRMVWRGAWPWA